MQMYCFSNSMDVLASLYTVRAHVCSQFVEAIILIMSKVMN